MSSFLEKKKKMPKKIEFINVCQYNLFLLIKISNFIFRFINSLFIEKLIHLNAIERVSYKKKAKIMLNRQRIWKNYTYQNTKGKVYTFLKYPSTLPLNFSMICFYFVCHRLASEIASRCFKVDFEALCMYIIWYILIE